MLVIAHAADMLTSLLYLAPVVIVIGVLVLQRARDRRRGPTEEPVEPEEEA